MTTKVVTKGVGTTMVAVEDLVELRELDGSFTPGGLGAVGWSASEVYGGTVFLIRQSAAVRALVEKVQAVIRTEIGDDEPQSIHLKRAGADLLGAVKAAQQAVRSATDVQNLARALFEAAGFSPDSICLDGVYLRVQPPGPTHAGLPTAPLPSHRDCWTSNLYSQINWWAPVFSVTKGRTITFYPDYWSKPIPNTSQDWNLDEISARKAKAEAGDYPVLPAILEPVKSLNELRIIAEP
ncbi:MAG: hypothetical protein ACPGNT_09625, partial [Rhodospirillales bacterium]